MADIADRISSIPAGDRGLLHTGVAIISVAFLIKAAIWPLNSWLAPTYTAASAPVAALFALMTKVGIYALVRVWTLFFPADSGSWMLLGTELLLVAGLITMVVGTIGMLGAIHLARIASYSLLVSSGTLLAALGIGAAQMLAAGLFYLLSATLAISALFLLNELLERSEGDGQHVLKEVDGDSDEDTNLDDDETPLVGRTIPVSNALIGLAFISAALVVAGLPPLSGFLAKLSLLMGALRTSGEVVAAAVRPSGWWIFGLLLLSGLVATVALSRAGIRYFWSSGVAQLRVKIAEAFSVSALILACVLLTIFAEPVLRYTRETAAGLHAPRAYIEGVLSMKPRPGPTRSDVNRPASP
jgi:multicomponent K+:H+ antiporter subunit D